MINQHEETEVSTKITKKALSEDSFIEQVFILAEKQGYLIERDTKGNKWQIDFGNKKLHRNHLESLYPQILNENIKIPYIIDGVAPGRPCTHKPMKEIILAMLNK